VYRNSIIMWLMGFSLLFTSVVAAQQLPFGITLPPSLNFATSPSPVGSGARAVGKGTAFIGVADDATAASHNPAGLVQLERPEVSVVGSYLLRFEGQDVTRPETVVEEQTLSGVDLNYLSVAYPFQLLQRNVVVSLNVQRLFDLRGATDVASRYTRLDGVQQVSSRQEGGLFTISPALAVQLTPTLSIGAAFNIWPDLFGNGWEQEVTVRGNGRVVPGNNMIVPFVSTGRIKEEFAFEGFNVTAGFLWTINSVFSLGGVVRTPFTAKVTRQHTSSLTMTLQNGTAPVTTQNRFRETLDMQFPIAYGLGMAARLSDHLTLAFDVSRIHWSDFRLQESTSDQVILVENGAPSGKGRAVLNGQGADTTTVRLGAEYLWVGSKLTIPWRAGFFYDPEPGDGGTDEFFGFSLGSGIAIGPWLFDMAYTFRAGTVHSTATDTTAHQHAVLASVIYHF
jgi:long-subunit fatty acid transport protein